MKFRSGLLLGTAFLAGLAVGPGALRLAGSGDFPGAALAREISHDNSAETVRLLTLLGTVMDVVKAEYVHPVSDKDPVSYTHLTLPPIRLV